ncbi:MAG: ATP-grasp domain-containing protein [Clostridia bacterium]|nr:ATP-grasp domain-containing protein [Clostridia bacterium]
MRGLLIYDKAGAERNEWFINRLIKCAKAQECDLELVIHPEETDGALKKSVDFVIVRTICPHLGVKAAHLNVSAFNNYLTSYVANDKWKSYVLSEKLGIAVMDTYKVSSAEEAMAALPFPFVLKAVDGHGGSGVFLVNNAEECKQTMSLLINKEVIAQKLCDEPGVDMRVYVMGDRILAAVKRTSNTDFRSNFSLGGSAELSKPTHDMIEAINKLKGSLSFDFVGVDFIRNNGRWVLNEIEDVVGTRMLYSLTDIDAADEYVRYIIERIKSKV